MPSRTSDKAADRDSPVSEHKQRHRHHHHGSRSKRTSSKADSEVTDNADSAIDVPELNRRNPHPSSPHGSRTSLPYPSFSKAHSREAVNSRESLTSPARKNLFTPDPTDLQQQHKSDVRESSSPRPPRKTNAPPSPPLTADDRATIIEEKRQSLEKAGQDLRKKLEKAKLGSYAESQRASPTGCPSSLLGSSIDQNEVGLDGVKSKHVRRTKSSTPRTEAKRSERSGDSSTISSEKRESRSISPASSSRTSIAPEQPNLQTPYHPNNTAGKLVPEWQRPPSTDFVHGRASFSPIDDATAAKFSSSIASPLPPPPPPPPIVPTTVPRVDYLMQHGGLPHPVTKHYLAAPEPQAPTAHYSSELPNPTVMAMQVERFFSPFKTLLDDYAKVMSKNGSIAVATGYRSIARRLLDRLEAVFARDISSETCSCVMCSTDKSEVDSDAQGGVSWGEILEFVSGRQELPQWPPLTLQNAGTGLGISAAEYKAPMQKLDIDVPEEYREHYIRQSKKTKQSVDRWLAGQTDTESPPDEADDDTLTFAVLTHLSSEERLTFSHLLGLASSRPPSVNPELNGSPVQNATNHEFISQTGMAIYRLYRLPNRPRLPECAMFLLRNPELHDVLATLAAISDAEWDILISGRFDGFLRSGADDLPPQSSVSNLRHHSISPFQQNGSTTTLHPQLSASAASAGAPVALDEETEILALAEVERGIFLGMEALEDAFEALHVRAELVRRALRDRGAGLSMQAQARKGGSAAAIEARLGTPGSARGGESEDDGIDDAISELAPDDSASNVSRSRIRRPRRRTERRTPAPVEEADEEADPKERAARAPPPYTREAWSRNSYRRK